MALSPLPKYSNWHLVLDKFDETIVYKEARVTLLIAARVFYLYDELG